MVFYFLAVLMTMPPQGDTFTLPPPDPIPEQVGGMPSFRPLELFCLERFLFCTDCVTCGGRCDPFGWYD